jgi:protein-S-isoprenylcysteine O-methyltransferase Ste14
MKKMSLMNQILLVNASILGGLAFEFFRGFPVSSIVITGVLLLSVANAIFLVRTNRLKKQQ